MPSRLLQSSPVVLLLFMCIILPELCDSFKNFPLKSNHKQKKHIYPASATPFLLTHVPKTSGWSFSLHYGIKSSSAIGTTLRSCGTTGNPSIGEELQPESAWARLEHTDQRWLNLKEGRCNLVTAHDQSQRSQESIKAVTGKTPFTFAFLRHPIERLFSLYSYLCITTDTGNCWYFVPEAVQNFGIKSLSNPEHCPPNTLNCTHMSNGIFKDNVILNEGPQFGNALTWYFQDLPNEQIGGNTISYERAESEQALLSATKRLDGMDVVLLTEYNEESICLFYWKAYTILNKDDDGRGAFLHAFDEECRVTKSGFAPDRSILERSANSSPHSGRTDVEFLEKYKNMIQNDIKLYESGVRKFCRQVYEMTQETGVAFFRISRLCPSYPHSDDKMAKHRHNFRG
jgi:hypothetical protein